MGKRVIPMQAYQLRRIKTPGRYAVGGVAGLFLVWNSPRSMSWILRAELHGKRPDFGLGSYPEITLEAARLKAAEWRGTIRAGIDPREERRQQVSKNTATALAQLTFADAAEKCWKVKSKEFRNVKHAEAWIKTVREYANPVLGKMLIQDIQRVHVLKVLEPLWERITDTASKLRGRIEAVISYGYALQNINDRKNPAAWADGLDALLASAAALMKKNVKHFPALPWTEVPRLMQRLAGAKGTGARALEFQIQTTSRGNEVRGARWCEIDWARKIWTIPGGVHGRMKNQREHRVPLTDAQLAWLKTLPRNPETDLIFPNAKGAMISDATIGKVIKDFQEADVNAAKRAGLRDEQIAAALKAGRFGFFDPIEEGIATPHGTSRSSFKDWVRANLSHRFSDEVSELCLAHVNSDATRAAYARDELMDLRRQMLDEWINYLRAPTRMERADAANTTTMSQQVAA